jgi:hypothetical protein
MLTDKLQKLFYKLPLPNISLECEHWLNTQFYEAEIARRNGGLDLGSQWQIRQLSDEESRTHERFVPGLNMLVQDIIKAINAFKMPVLNKDDPKDGKCACAMQVNNTEELAELALIIYQIAYHNYVLSSRKNSMFPFECCGSTTRNIYFSALLFGFTNALYASSKSHDHAYNVFPWIMPEQESCGCIVVDGTSDQLWSNNEKESRPRNCLWFIPGKYFEYKTHRMHGWDLYPEYATHLGILNKLGRHSSSIREMIYFKSCLEEAFQHPITLSLNLPNI